MAILLTSGVLATWPGINPMPSLPPSFDTDTLVALPTASPPTIDGAQDSVWDQARSVEVLAFGASGGFPSGSGIRVRALHNDTTLFLLFEWVDATEDFAQDAWVLVNNSTPEGVWSRPGWGDDSLAVFFDNGTGPDQSFSQSGCAISCHTAGVNEMRLEGAGMLDVWLWSSSRSNAFAYMDDRYLDNSSKVNGSASGGLHGDGPDPWTNNTIATAFGDRPAFLNASVPPSTSPHYVTDTDTLSLDWSTFDSGLLPNGTRVPGAVLSQPTGGRGDLTASGVYTGSSWRLEVARPFVTGDSTAHDVPIIDLDRLYSFSLAVANNKTGINHSTAFVPYKLVLADNVLPDLVLRAATLEADPVLIGRPVNVTVAVRNAGFGNSSAIVFVGVNDNTTGLEIANGSVPVIMWADEYLANMSFSSVGYLPGRYNFTALVDTAGSESESLEGNNALAFQVNFVSTLEPSDLIIASAVAPAAPVFAGDTFAVSGTVRNGGLGDSVFDVTVRGGAPFFPDQTVDLGPIAAGESANYSLSFSSAGFATGSYNFILQVDPDGLIAESNESNNSQPVSVGVEARCDLVAAELTADPAAAGPADVVNVTLGIRNAGAAINGSIDVWLYLDDGISTGAQNRTAIWSSLAVQLATGVRVNYSAPWTLPGGITPGNHLLRAWVDAGQAFDEIAETNNNASLQLLVQNPKRPDLSTESVVFNQSSYRAGATGTLTVTVANLGVNYTDIVNLSAFDAQANRSFGVLPVNPIPANSSAVFIFTFVAPPGPFILHHVLVMVDAENVTWEENELNNPLTATYTLLPPAQPDLAVVRITFDPPNPTRGDHVVISAEVRNVGNATANATQARFLYGTSEIGTVGVAALAPDESVVVTVTWNTSAVASTVALIQVASDALDEVLEPDESNNRFEITVFFVRPGSPSLSIATLTATPGAVVSGDFVVIEVSVRNDGTAAGSGMIAIKVDGAVIGSSNFTLQPNGTHTYAVNWEATDAGNHTVRAELSSTGVVVEQRVAPVDVAARPVVPATPWGTFAIAAIALVAVALVVLMRLRRKPPQPGPSLGQPTTAPAESPPVRPPAEDAPPTDTL